MQLHPHFWVRAVRARLALLSALGGRAVEAPAELYLALLDAHPSLWDLGHLRDELWSLQALGPDPSGATLVQMEQALRAVLVQRAPGATALFELRGSKEDTAESG